MSERRWVTAAATFPVVGLFYVGFLKGSALLEWLPTEPTVTMYVLLAVTWMFHVLGTLRLPRGLGAVVGLVAAFAFVLLLFPFVDGDYATTKLQLLFGLTLPAAFMSATLISNVDRAWWLARWSVLWGAGLALALRYAPAAPELYGRLGLEGDTIAVGRACGAAVVAAVALGVGGKWRWPLVTVVAGALLLVTLGSGSRGPLVAGALAVVAILAAQRGSRRFRLLFIATAAAVVGAPWALSLTNSLAASRIVDLFSGHPTGTVAVRERMYEYTADYAVTHPLGGGWGSLATAYLGQPYPHNIYLEVFAEGGWIAGAALVAVSVLATVRSWRVARVPGGAVILGLLVFWLANAQVSGDVNSNRAAFAMLAVGLTAPLLLRAAKPESEPLRPTSRKPGRSPSRSRSRVGS